MSLVTAHTASSIRPDCCSRHRTVIANCVYSSSRCSDVLQREWTAGGSQRQNLEMLASNPHAGRHEAPLSRSRTGGPDKILTPTSGTLIACYPTPLVLGGRPGMVILIIHPRFPSEMRGLLRSIMAGTRALARRNTTAKQKERRLKPLEKQTQPWRPVVRHCSIADFDAHVLTNRGKKAACVLHQSTEAERQSNPTSLRTNG